MGCIGPSIVVLQFGTLYKLSRYDVTVTLHNFTSARERLPEPASNGQTISNRLHQHTDTPGVDPRPPPPPPAPGRLNYSFLSRSGIKMNQIKVAGSFFLFNHLPLSLWKQQKNVRKKGFVWEESKPRTLVVSENMFTCLNMSGYILFDMWIVLHLFTLPFSFFQYLHQSIKKVY